MSGPRPVVVVGAGLAGARTAESLRAEGWDGPIVLLGAEPHRPYERPPLTKGYLSGGEDREKLFVHPEGWYADNGVDLRTSARAVRLDRAEREVVLETGERIRYGHVVLATGRSPRRLQLPGAVLDGVLTLRTRDPRVLAVGDVASAYHPVLGHHLCVEHWANALHQPETAAKVITGSDAVHDAMPYFFSDQYDSALEYVGHHGFGDDLLVRSGAGGMALVACWLRDGQVMAGMHLNDFDAMPALKRLVGSRVDVDRLADPAVPLAQV
jgi:3-phenylpropionate/trans-cinnamate dioxygenase ferredoxin reductase subunit